MGGDAFSMVFECPVPTFPLIIYKDSRPLRVARIVHAKRDVKRLLKNR